MKARIVSAAVVAVLVVASQASASVISASSQTARSKPADKVDYLSVTAMQGELNASTREAADASAPTALGSKSVPSTTSGGFLLTSEPVSNSRFRGLGGSAMESLFNPDREKTADMISRDFSGPGTVIANGSSGGRWGGGNHGGGNHGGKGGKKGGKHGGKHGGGGHGRDRGGVQPTPEPSTWLLLGTGLALVGVIEVVRRRA